MSIMSFLTSIKKSPAGGAMIGSLIASVLFSLIGLPEPIAASVMAFSMIYTDLSIKKLNR